MPDHEKYMKIALGEAEKSLTANDFPVGCVMVANKEIIARGRRQNSTPEAANELDHAEIIALRDLIDNHPQVERNKITVYSTMEPCLMCFATLLLNGLRRIVYAYEDIMGGGGNLPLKELSPLYSEMEVQVIPHVMRSESLSLFKKFFRNPANNLLAKYTLEQTAGTD